MSLNEIVRSSISRAGVIRVRNALNPLLWLSAVGPALSWTASYLLRDDLVLRYAFAALGALPILSAILTYFILLFRDPDRLQSEEFILRQQELSMVERKGEGSARIPKDVVVSEASLPAQTSGPSPGDRP